MTDWKRLNDLATRKDGLQYGKDTDGTVSVSGVVNVFGRNIIRWEGEGDCDINPWRVYLGAWAPQNNLDAAATIADVMPGIRSVMPAEYNTIANLSMEAVQVWAKVTWASGQRSNIAYVDWPVRGCLIQVSGRYVQVDALAGGAFNPEIVDRNLPILGATLSVEPGGGDSAAAATFTMVPLVITASDPVDPVTGRVGANYVIPPYARTVRLLANWDEISKAQAAAAVKASLDLSTKTTNVDTVIAAQVAGTAGNAFTIAFVADGSGTGTLTLSGSAYTFHFDPLGTTTVADFEALITASANLEVQTAGTGANLITTPADVFGATHLAGGAAAVPGNFLAGLYIRQCTSLTSFRPQEPVHAFFPTGAAGAKAWTPEDIAAAEEPWALFQLADYIRIEFDPTTADAFWAYPVGLLFELDL